MRPLSHGRPASVIVKIGGSLLREGAPSALLARLAAASHLALVPGGGVLADAVRDAQPQLGLSDKAAHAMAILAMEQMAHALLDLAPGLVPCRTLVELTAPRQAAALWFPAGMLIGAPGIAESWDVTSDSLALWLARTLGATRLVLLKAADARHSGSPLAQAELPALAAAGLIDGAFEGMAHGFKGSIVVANADDSEALAEALHLEAQAPGNAMKDRS